MSERDDVGPHRDVVHRANVQIVCGIEPNETCHRRPSAKEARGEGRHLVGAIGFVLGHGHELIGAIFGVATVRFGKLRVPDE